MCSAAATDRRHSCETVLLENSVALDGNQQAEQLTTNLGVRSSNLFGRAITINNLAHFRDIPKKQIQPW